jgi:hypothetical protein
VGKDRDACPKDHRFVPMIVGDTNGRLILTPRDAVTLKFTAYSDDRSRGVVSNLTLNLKGTFPVSQEIRSSTT